MRKIEHVGGGVTITDYIPEPRLFVYRSHHASRSTNKFFVPRRHRAINAVLFIYAKAVSAQLREKRGKQYMMSGSMLRKGQTAIILAEV